MCVCVCEGEGERYAVRHSPSISLCNKDTGFMALLFGTPMKITSQQLNIPSLLLSGTKDSYYGNVHTPYVEDNHHDLRL